MPLPNAVRTDWRDFPDVVIHAPLRSATRHPDYEVAKAGDIDAALRVVQAIVSDVAIEEIRRQLTGAKPIVVAVHGMEAISVNEIPTAFASLLSYRLGWPINREIIQAAKVSRTGADGFHRLANSPPFDGAFPAGACAIIVDDTLIQGGALASLKGHIESQGGYVLLAAVLTGKQYSAKIAISTETCENLRERYGPLEIWWRAEFGYGFDRLTESEARYLLRGGQDVDTLRNRILASR